MTPQEKAIVLVKSQNVSYRKNVKKHKKNAALIQLNLMINSETNNKFLNYLLEVKREIEKL